MNDNDDDDDDDDDNDTKNSNIPRLSTRLCEKIFYQNRSGA